MDGLPLPAPLPPRGWGRLGVRLLVAAGAAMVLGGMLVVLAVRSAATAPPVEVQERLAAAFDRRPGSTA